MRSPNEEAVISEHSEEAAGHKRVMSLIGGP